MKGADVKRKISFHSPVHHLLAGIIVLVVSFPVLWILVEVIGILLKPELIQCENIFNQNSLSLFLRSFFISLIVVLISTSFTFPLAFLFEFYSISGSNLFRTLLLLPIFFPPYIWAVSWMNLLGDSGLITTWMREILQSDHFSLTIFQLWGTVFILALWIYPLSFLFISSSLRRVRKHIESASLSHGRFTTFTRIILPLTKKGLITGMAVTFLMTFSNLGVPGLLRQNVYPVEIFIQYGVFFNHNGALAFSLPYFGLAFLFIALILITPDHPDQYIEPRKINLTGKKQILVKSSISIFLLLLLVLPVISLFSSTSGIESFANAITISWTQITNSFVFSIISAIILTITGFYLAWYTKNRRYAKLINTLMLIILCTPGIIYGITLIKIFNLGNLAGIVYSTQLIAVFCNLKYFPVSYLIMQAVFSGISFKFTEASVVSGHGMISTIYRIIIPMVKNGIAGALILTFILCFSELDTIILVSPPGFDTIPMQIFSLMHYGATDMVCALSIIQIILICLTVIIGWKWIQRTPYVH